MRWNDFIVRLFISVDIDIEWIQVDMDGVEVLYLLFNLLYIHFFYAIDSVIDFCLLPFFF